MEWRNALHDFEENPPSHCWSEIKESLDQDIPAIRKQLYEYSENPPLTVGQKILSQIEGRKKTNIFYLSRSKVMAAASLAVLLALSVLYIISSPENRPKVGAAVYQSGNKEENATRSYILFTNQKGEQINISPKLHSVLQPTVKRNDSLIQTWQKKLSNSAYVPTGNNFFDIAEMVHILEEDEKR